MKQAIITNIDGRKWGARFDDPSEWIAEQIKLNSWGLPERTVIVDSEPYTEDDILEKIPAVMDGDEQLEPPKVRLRAQYQIEIEDISDQIAAEVAKKQERAEAVVELKKVSELIQNAKGARDVNSINAQLEAQAIAIQRILKHLGIV